MTGVTLFGNLKDLLLSWAPEMAVLGVVIAVLLYGVGAWTGDMRLQSLGKRGGFASLIVFGVTSLIELARNTSGSIFG